MTGTDDNTLRRRTILTLAVLVLAAYVSMILFVGPKLAIEAMNVLVLALATGIVTAYYPVARQAFRNRLIEGGDILSIGIFVSWLGVVIARGGSILWRLNDKPPEWLDSAWWGAHIAASAIGALCHLVAPEAVAGRVPTRHWIKVGLWVAAAVLTLGTLLALNLD